MQGSDILDFDFGGIDTRYGNGQFALISNQPAQQPIAPKSSNDDFFANVSPIGQRAPDQNEQPKGKIQQKGVALSGNELKRYYEEEGNRLMATQERYKKTSQTTRGEGFGSPGSKVGFLMPVVNHMQLTSVEDLERLLKVLIGYKQFQVVDKKSEKFVGDITNGKAFSDLRVFAVNRANVVAAKEAIEKNVPYTPVELSAVSYSDVILAFKTRFPEGFVGQRVLKPEWSLLFKSRAIGKLLPDDVVLRLFKSNWSYLFGLNTANIHTVMSEPEKQAYLKTKMMHMGALTELESYRKGSRKDLIDKFLSACRAAVIRFAELNGCTPRDWPEEVSIENLWEANKNAYLVLKEVKQKIGGKGGNEKQKGKLALDTSSFSNEVAQRAYNLAEMGHFIALFPQEQLEKYRYFKKLIQTMQGDKSVLAIWTGDPKNFVIQKGNDLFPSTSFRWSEGDNIPNEMIPETKPKLLTNVASTARYSQQIVVNSEGAKKGFTTNIDEYLNQSF